MNASDLPLMLFAAGFGTRMGDLTGVGTLETVVFGRHDPSGFKSILDGAP